MSRAGFDTPRRRVEAECERRGAAAVVADCVRLLRGEQVQPAVVRVLGGEPADWALDGAPGERDHWLRLWGARGLLWAGVGPDAEATPAVVSALSDRSWRVREMAAKVVARHQVGDALDAVAALRDDPLPRVRAAAERAVVLLTAAGA